MGCSRLCAGMGTCIITETRAGKVALADVGSRSGSSSSTRSREVVEVGNGSEGRLKAGGCLMRIQWNK